MSPPPRQGVTEMARAAVLDLGDLVAGDDRGQAEDAGGREWDKREEDHAGQCEVLPHDPPGPTGVGEDVGKVVEVFAEEGDIGGLDGDVAAGGAHGDADLRGGESRGIVDPIADHGHRTVAPL